ncbi:TPA: hypothetical protein K8054_000239 [Staphylococcus pseudintermedius]|uniref:hypothetical protein n=1 Tax=Staphylococcus pseudintermedius TaxID=283734 RepID=UPI0014410AF3|nr:hypothetical protein [Staphylococcus pseudintermedius]EGQ2792915.1 hypothetical protein [Staphylococcus pseudintermedius]EGQ2829491.1 hypothetical protein [Staphylococcus pseudintermedius]EGQ2845660.1 hypothetical protein [Staphylococcus pseudintermedius]EGQ2850738.1 hypothetical protein [Staphylococcus pseudintermedius]EGQ2862669.1 hypothetical protein [Staphylococcus pseudintermedius]
MSEFMLVSLISFLLALGFLLIRQIILTDSLALVILYQMVALTMIAIALDLAENTRNPNIFILNTVFTFTLIAMDARKMLKKGKQRERE